MTIDMATRLREMDLRRVPPAVWLLVVLALASLLIRAVIVPAEPSVRALVAALATGLGPLLLAAAAILFTARLRLLVAGSIIVATTALIDLALLLLAQPMARHYLPRPEGLLVAADLAIAVGLVAGPLLMGRELGRARSGMAWLTVAVAVGVGIGMAVWAMASWIRIGLLEPGAEVPFAPIRLAAAGIGQLAVVGWTYLLVTAGQRRMRWLATGAALHVAVVLLLVGATIALNLFPPPAGVTYPLLGYVADGLRIAAWSALIVGVVKRSA